MVKLLITSDINLGSTDSVLSINDQEKYFSFDRILLLAKEHNVLIMCGNIFNDNADDACIITVKNKLVELALSGISIILCPGANDYKIISRDFSNILSENIQVFSAASELQINEQQISGNEIFFYNYFNPGASEVINITRKTDSGVHIALLNFDIKKNNFLVDSEFVKMYIAKKLMDFYAVGGDENFRIYKIQNDIIAAYPGSPEISSLTDIGNKYCLSIEISENKIIKYKRIAVNYFSIKKIELDLTNKFCGDIINILETTMINDNIIYLLNFYGIRNFVINDTFISTIRGLNKKFHITDSSIGSCVMIIDDYCKNCMSDEYILTMKNVCDRNVSGNIDSISLSSLINIFFSTDDYTEEMFCRYFNV